MKLKFAAPLAIAATTLGLALAAPANSHAITYLETTDAGDLPASAAVVYGTAGTPLTAITGTLAVTNAISESDMFEIYIPNPSAFAVNTNFTPGYNNFNTQVFIFSAAGLGLVGNDDNPAGGQQSLIPAGSFSGAAGLYYVLISGFGRFATSSGGLIFPNSTDGATSETALLGPTGPGGGSAISGYTGNSNEGGSYILNLTGAQVVAVPEPSTYAAMIAGAGLLGFVARRRAVR